MELTNLVAESIDDTKASLWPAFGPELVLCLTMLAMLLLRLFRLTNRLNAFWIALIGSAIALYVAYPAEYLGSEPGPVRTELFTGMLVFDGFSVFVRSLLLLFLVLFALFTRLSGIPDKQDSADFYCMVLGAALGMCLMASANHLLTIFLAVEMASVPSYALAAMLKGRRKASEAALKYAVYGAGAAGVMLYGISLLAGITNSAHLPTIAAELSTALPTMTGGERMVLALAALMIGTGLAFKLSAFPFHFWCPDVFEGASAEVDAFLSVASKAGALALLVRVCLGIGLLPSTTATQAVSEVFSVPATGVFSVADPEVEPTRLISDSVSAVPVAHADALAHADGLTPVRTFVAILLAFVSAITMTFGNLAAYGQHNIKRLFAYSTIAHAGYMMLPVAVAMTVATSHPDIAQRAIAALAIYMGLYLFMNLTAFAIIAFLRNGLRSEEISAYAGLFQRSPGVVVCFAVVLFSLIGMPPFAGFIGKFAIFASLAESYQATNLFYLLVLLVLGGLNTVLSLFYYLRIVKVMAIDPEPERPASFTWSMVSLSGGFVALITVPLILFFFSWGSLNQWAMTAAASLF